MTSPSSKPLENLGKIITAFQAEKYDLDSYQIAESLWLWYQKQPIGTDIKDESDGNRKEKSKILTPNTIPEQLSSTVLPSSLPLTLSANSQEETENNSEETNQNKDEYKDEIKGLPISPPDTAFLRNTLLLGRLAKPLIKKIEDITRKELDIRRTINDTSEYSLGIKKANKQRKLTIIPNYKHQKVRALDAILIIEECSSMVIWKDMASEVRDWLERLGAFRDVKLYRMGWEETVNKVKINPFFSQVQTLSPKDLNHPRGERLILFFSDCTSPAWYEGRYNKVLKEWGTKQIVTLLSPFPEKLWHRTALSQGWRVQLQNEYPRRPPKQWKMRNLPDLLSIKLEMEYEEKEVKNTFNQYIKQEIESNYFSLPILSLTPHSTAAWSQVIDGNYDAFCAGRLLEIEPNGNSNNSPFSDIPSSETQAEKAIKIFENTASYYAWELMKKLSAVPINLSVIRLIQQELISYSTPSDIAEVLLSNLLQPKTPFNFFVNTNQLEFEFISNIRQLLLEELGKTRAIEVIAKLSDYIAQKIGLSTRDFQALLLTNPQELKQKEGSSLIRAFALISAEVFSQLGDEFQQLAETLKASGQQMTWDDILPEHIQKSDWIVFLETIAEHHQLTRRETESLTALLPELDRLNSIQKAAENLKIHYHTLSHRLSSKIYRKFEAKNPNLFVDSPRNKLKTLQKHLQSQYQNPPTLEISSLETFEFEAKAAIIVSEEEEPLQQWTFQTPTVNSRGETIKTTTHTASYFTETLTDNVILEMVAIPGGTFTMGSPESESEYDDERPQHNVTLSPFFMGKYPITQGQWKAIASRTDLKVNIDLDEEPSNFKDPYQKDQETIERWLRPVEQVNWYEAVEFCQRLSKLTGRDYQLPSEAQWEYACRAIISDQSSVISHQLTISEWNSKYCQPFSFGETITGELANYNASETYADEPKGDYREETTPVGQFPANAFGLYDMHGNVWEWCADDWHDNYGYAPTDGSAWIDDDESDNLTDENMEDLNKNDDNDSYSVLRGGSWNVNPDGCRSAYRNYVNRRYSHYNYDGFRVVCVFGSE